MNFDFSDDQKFLKGEARKYLEANCPASKVRAVLDAEGLGFDAALWKGVAEQGWMGAAIPEEYGGLGLGHLELCAIAEELGRVVAPIPFASTVYILAEAVMLAGDDAQKAEILPKIAAGELIGALATSEGPGVLTAATLKATVSGGKLSGVKIPVTDGDIANLCLVIAKENGQPGLFLVDLAGAGVTREAVKTLDPARDAAKLTFKDAPAQRLGPAGEGFALLEQVLDRAAILLSFEQCGGADKCLEMAKAYALERYAFGRVIASYQAIKHKLADMYVKNELARSNAYYGAWALNTNAPEMPIAASAARIAASEAFWFASKENIQTHGGIGFTWEMDCHLYYRRSRQLSLVAGAPRVWKERLVSHLEKERGLMDFNDTPEEAAYRAEVRKWLDANAPKKAVADDGEGGGSMAASKAWQAKKAAAGYAQITWPKEWGGAGGTPIQQVIFNQEEAKHPIPGNPFQIGLGMCVPTVATFADQATKDRFVGPALRGEEIWCQLFSEPSGGSDVAAARTKAVRASDGSGDWLISGQKVWTTGAQFSDFGIVVCRTNPDAPKHKGLTMFWLDMHSPGVEVKPIHQMSGGSGFNEVFFTDVRVKDSQRVGEIDDGWRVSLVTLMNERLAVGGASGAGWAAFMEAARGIAGLDGAPAIKDQALREKIADWYVQAEGLKHTRNRTMTALSRGQTPGPESSIGKIVSAQQMQELANAAIEMLDQFGIINDPELAPLQAGFHTSLMFAPGLRIAGGTDEILKNIIAERVLGLPGDIRVDKDIAFKDMPTGR